MKRTVTFYSPGTFVSEEDQIMMEGKSLNDIIEASKERAKRIKQRHGAIPYGFKIKGCKTLYFLPHCKVVAFKDIPKTDENSILISNCEMNKWGHIVETTKGWKMTLPFTDGCVLLN